MMHKVTYIADGDTSEFIFNFPFFQPDDVKASVNFDIQPNTTYTIIPNEPRSDGKYIGGKIVFKSVPIHGAEITIWRKIELGRTIDYQPTLPISTDSLNADFNFLLEYLRDIYELDNNVANIENGLQFLDSIQSQIDALGDFSQLATKAELAPVAFSNDFTDLENPPSIPNPDDFAPVNHTHNEYATHSETDELSERIDTLESGTGSLPQNMDYVEYWDSADTTDHSHAKPGVATPTDHGWYRVYKSGWCEQGGQVTDTQSATQHFTNVNLPIYMVNIAYYATATDTRASGTTNYAMRIVERTVTKIKVSGTIHTDKTYYNNSCLWYVCGNSFIIPE